MSYQIDKGYNVLPYWILPVSHDAYNVRVRVRGWNTPVNARQVPKLLRGTLHAWTKEDHRNADSYHIAAADALDVAWIAAANRAAKATFGRSYEATDYQVSGIACSEFPEHYKELLRYCAHTASAHREIAAAHRHCARYGRRIPANT